MVALLLFTVLSFTGLVSKGLGILISGYLQVHVVAQSECRHSTRLYIDRVAGSATFAHAFIKCKLSEKDYCYL